MWNRAVGVGALFATGGVILARETVFWLWGKFLDLVAGGAGKVSFAAVPWLDIFGLILMLAGVWLAVWGRKKGTFRWLGLAKSEQGDGATEFDSAALHVSQCGIDLSKVLSDHTLTLWFSFFNATGVPVRAYGVFGRVLAVYYETHDVLDGLSLGEPEGFPISDNKQLFPNNSVGNVSVRLRVPKLTANRLMEYIESGNVLLDLSLLTVGICDLDDEHRTRLPIWEMAQIHMNNGRASLGIVTVTRVEPMSIEVRKRKRLPPP